MRDLETPKHIYTYFDLWGSEFSFNSLLYGIRFIVNGLLQMSKMFYSLVEHNCMQPSWERILSE